MSGGYDDGYMACPCFWGSDPGSLVRRLTNFLQNFRDLSVLDLGCGEGKNSIFFARQGANVEALDVSEVALQNARRAWPDFESVNWQCVDVRLITLNSNRYDVVIAYGLLHCLLNGEEIERVVRSIQSATADGGYNLLCAFNDRHQDLSAHPDFYPTLMSHRFYEDLYRDWDLLFISDEDLHETHPHNNIPHCHSMTRLIAKRKPT